MVAAKAAVMAAGIHRHWSLSEDAFRGLLRWLDEGVDSDGEKYLEIRRRLVQYFDRKNCSSPNDLADETLNRVARRLAERGPITDTPATRYCYIVAKFVFLEYHRSPARAEVSIDGVHGPGGPPSGQLATRSDVATEHRIHCLESCLQNLAPAQRNLILEYYQGDQRGKIENRRKLAVTLGITMNALSIRACRVRDSLEGCVRKCCSQ